MNSTVAVLSPALAALSEVRNLLENYADQADAADQPCVIEALARADAALITLSPATLERTYTRAELDKVIATIEADIRHAEANEATSAAQNLHGHAWEWQNRAKGLGDVRVRVLALLQS